MKYMKKFIALIAVLTLALAMAVPAFAETTTPTTYTITINNGTGTYAAYQIFKGDLHEDVDLHEDTLSNIEWGDNVTAEGQEKLGNAAKKAKELTGETEAKAFAVEVAEYLGGTPSIVTVDSNGTGTITGLAAGYYLIKNDAVGKDEVYTDYILQVVENVTVQPKSGKPTLDKQIKHNDDGKWGVVGDNQIGDTVEFRTITTVPNVSGYSKYEYVIHDEMSAGLTSNVRNNNSNNDVTIKVNDETVLNKEYYTVEVDTGKPNQFTVTIDVLKAIQDETIKTGDTLYTYYTGILNEKAEVYDAGKQDNKAYLVYSNNPHGTTTNKTPEKVVYDWTFKMEVNKVDGADNTKLTGAKFVLSKNENCPLGTIGDDGTPSITTDLIKLIDNKNGSYTVAPDGYTGPDPVVYVMTAGNITINGLDDDTYYLYETKAPAGYNRLTDAVKFKITAGYDETGKNCTSVTTKVNGEDSKAGLSITVKNNKGASLPSTGGIGTTLFYVIGGGLMAVAAVLLVTKKRMNSK